MRPVIVGRVIVRWIIVVVAVCGSAWLVSSIAISNRVAPDLVVSAAASERSDVVAARVGTDASGAGTLARLGWLVGTWERQAGGRRVHETWAWAGEHVLRGSAFVIQDGNPPRQTEWIVLAEMAGDVFYIARPIENANPTPFRLVAIHGDTTTFENPQHDFPQRIRYVRSGSDSLLVSVEGPDADKRPQRIAFRFARRD